MIGTRASLVHPAERLRARRAELVRALARDAAEIAELTESEADEFLSQHPADLGTVLQLTEQAVGARELVKRELDEVEHALARVAAGTYGVCGDCGSEIGAERLDVLPCTPRCVACQRLLERERHGS